MAILSAFWLALVLSIYYNKYILNTGGIAMPAKCELPMILHLKKLILCNLHKMSFFLILLQLSDRR